MKIIFLNTKNLRNEIFNKYIAFFDQTSNITQTYVMLWT